MSVRWLGWLGSCVWFWLSWLRGRPRRLILLTSSGRGVQLPRVESVPRRVESWGADAVDLCGSAGLVLDPWQAYALEQMLGRRADGLWSAFECALVVPRQNGKGAVLEARALAGLFLLDEQLILWSAHQFKTAREAFRRVVGYVENTPSLKARVKNIRTSHGEEGIELKSGQRLQFVARSRTSGRGFTGDVAILDECQVLDAEDMAALLPTLSTRPNPQVIYTGTVDDAATQLRGLRERALAGDDPSLCYLEWSAADDCDPADRVAWAQANPALGIRISEEFISREYAAMVNDLDWFKQERLSIWPKRSPGGVFTADQWAACVDEGSSMLDPVCFGVDVSPDRAWAAVGVAGLRADGSRHVELVEYRRGTSWVVERVAELVAKWRPAAVVVDAGSPAGSLLADLQSARVDVVLTSTRDYAQACGGFFDAVDGGFVRHRGQAELDEAVLGAQRRPLGDAWAWARKASTSVDISPLVAVTLAHWATRSVQVSTPMIVDPWEVADA